MVPGFGETFDVTNAKNVQLTGGPPVEDRQRIALYLCVESTL